MAFAEGDQVRCAIIQQGPLKRTEYYSLCDDIKICAGTYCPEISSLLDSDGLYGFEDKIIENAVPTKVILGHIKISRALRYKRTKNVNDIDGIKQSNIEQVRQA